MTQRDPLMVLLFSFLSCGLYNIYHTYVTSQEVAEFTGSPDINVSTELLLNVVTCGLFGMYSSYRNVQLLDTHVFSRNPQHQSQAQTLGLMFLLTFVVGVTWWVGVFLYQQELNKAAAMGAGAPAAMPQSF